MFIKASAVCQALLWAGEGAEYSSLAGASLVLAPKVLYPRKPPCALQTRMIAHAGVGTGDTDNKPGGPHARGGSAMKQPVIDFFVVTI